MKRIFVVDDNISNLLVVEDILSEQYEVFTLSSAKLMFDLLEKVVPDLILLDLLMPEINGFDALKQLKEDLRFADIKVVILTSKGDAPTEAFGFELGAVDFIRKPFSTLVLLDRVGAALSD